MRQKLFWIGCAITTLLLALVVACDSLDDDTADDDSTTVPTVESSAPLDGASGVYLNGFCSATFSVAMDGDTELALTAAAGLAPDVTELGAGNIGGMTLYPGVYKWGTGLLIPTDVTLVGTEMDVWVFQIAQDLTIASGTNVLLTGGAVPQNVLWQVSGFVDLGTTAHCEGIILAQTAITLRTGASVNGRLLAQTAVDIDSSAVVEPVP
jgi:hypothetical protein